LRWDANSSFVLAGGLDCTEQIALHLGAAERAQQLLLLLGLGAFRRRRHVARGRDIHHGLHVA
jgi:hypothetical protein